MKYYINWNEIDIINKKQTTTIKMTTVYIFTKILNFILNNLRLLYAPVFKTRYYQF